jgi:hypothetical protein
MRACAGVPPHGVASEFIATAEPANVLAFTGVRARSSRRLPRCLSSDRPSRGRPSPRPSRALWSEVYEAPIRSASARRHSVASFTARSYETPLAAVNLHSRCRDLAELRHAPSEAVIRS